MATNQASKTAKPVAKTGQQATGQVRTGAMEAISIRNRFFYIYYRKISLLFMCSLGICAFALVTAFYFGTKKTPPVYLPVSEDGRLVQSFPLSQPSIGDPEVMNSTVSQWALDGVRKFYTYDYLNFTDQINAAQPYFTIRGWNNTFTEFEKSQTLNTVLQQKIIVNYVPMGPPEITYTGLKDGRLGWVVEIPSQIKYIPHDGKSTGFVQTGKIKLVILRISLVDSPKGIGIDALSFEEKAKK